VAGRHHPCGTVDAGAVVALLGDPGLGRVPAHSYAELDAVEPLVRRQRPLRLRGRERGVPRAPKDVEERVALRIDFVAAVRGKGLANHTPIAFSARAGSTDEFDPRHESDPMTDPR
jgi:hypothetical protein